MVDEFNSLPDDYVSRFEHVNQKDIIASMRERSAPRPLTRWALANEIRPSDLYCYLAARFGPPNGIQNLLRKDDSDNLVHWEWYLKTPTGPIMIAGLNFRTDVWITGANLPESEKVKFVLQIKADFANYGKDMSHIRQEHLEPWIEFVNPYQRLRRAVKQLVKELDELNLEPSSDALPSLLESDNVEEATKQWKERAGDYSRATGLSFGIRAMVPVMAESFINLLLFILVLHPIRLDKPLFDSLFRLPMHVRIRSLPYYCAGFKGPIDSDHQAIKGYLRLIATRNDLLHGNIDIDNLKFNELYFYGTVPIFNQYHTMWERSHGVAHRAVGLEEVHAEIVIVDALVEYLLGLLNEKVRKSVDLISGKFDLGIRKDTGRLGILFSETLVDFGFPKVLQDEKGNP